MIHLASELGMYLLLSLWLKFLVPHPVISLWLHILAGGLFSVLGVGC